ncbi:MAG TPA: hypothetical protein VFV75_21020 [Candidatus Polarisedimenticolaceae bacterium]|nr:hypothetical protein [Candidatus Polarisedimenticolaceae bacterium]
MTGPRIFLLSPASCGGERARVLLREEASFPLAVELRERGASLGEVFAFLSGLYFRGKLAYARAFARPPARVPGVLVITPTRGLADPGTRVTRDDLLEFAAVDVASGGERYRAPLLRDGTSLAAAAGPQCEVVLLGSIATGKYLDVLQQLLGERLRFPLEFVGRGDMSRGGLLLRCVEEGRELTYGAVPRGRLRGARPAKLPPRA